MNTYGRTIDDRLRQGADKMGELFKKAASTITGSEPEGDAKPPKNTTPARDGSCDEKNWCREWDLNPHDPEATGF